jgi:hypothetical protein
MKGITAYILIFIFTLPLIVNILVIGDYALRFQYYKEVLCENKNRPESTCFGTCQLKHRLQHSENTQEPVLSSLVSFTIEALIQTLDVYRLSVEKYESLTEYPEKCCSYYSVFGKVPTPPPKV